MTVAADKVSVDQMLADAITKMDALTKRMDALEVGEKKIIKGDDDDDKKSDRSDKVSASKSDDDDDDKGSKKGDDAITAPKTKIKDDAKGAKAADAADPPPPVKKGDDGELEIKHGKEKDDSVPGQPQGRGGRGDAFPPPKKKADKAKADDDDDDKKDDDDDDDKKDDAVKDDAAELRRQVKDSAATIARLEAMLKPKSDEEHAAFADAQSRADGVFSGFGSRAPRPLEGEALGDYRRRLATKLKSHSATWKNIKFSKLDDEAFAVAEAQVYSDATGAASNPVDLEAGELREVTKIDPQTGVRSIVFYGKESFVKGMGRPGRRVASFRTMASQ
jgi:hypothetical protein